MKNKTKNHHASLLSVIRDFSNLDYCRTQSHTVKAAMVAAVTLLLQGDCVGTKGPGTV